MASASTAPPLDPHLALYQALADFQSEAAAVPKDGSNPHFRSTYATLASVVAALRPAAAHGLSHSQTFEQTADGGTLLVTTIYHRSGGSIRSALPIAFQADWQKNGSAITYARRYSLLAAFGLAADDDDDGNTAAPAPVRQQQARNGANPDDRSLTIATARKRLLEAGLSAAGAQAMLAELAPPGVTKLDGLPLPILKKLATTGASTADINRWNGVPDTASDANPEHDETPLADPALVAQLAATA